MTVGTVGDEFTNKVHTLYDCQSRINKIDAIAKTLGMSRSELYRQATQPYIDRFEGGEIKKPEFDLDKKKQDLLKARQKEQQWCDQLEKIRFGRQSGLEVMIAFAVRLGTDDKLIKNIEEVLLQLQTYEVNGSEPFDRSLLNVFIFFVEAVLNRRSIDAEITEFYRSKA